MGKIEKGFIINSFHEAASLYADATKKLGLWQSEKYAFEKYLYQDDAILDIGCGTGRTTFALYKTGFQNITGIDLTPAMLNEAEKIAHEHNLDIPFILGDATNLPFKDASFDKAIFAFNGLMQIPQRQNRTLALKEINRILKPEGIFIFTTHDRNKNENHLNFWEQEEIIWCGGKQDERLYEFGGYSHTRNASTSISQHNLKCLIVWRKQGLQSSRAFTAVNYSMKTKMSTLSLPIAASWIAQKSGSAF